MTNSWLDGTAFLLFVYVLLHMSPIAAWLDHLIAIR